MLIKNIIKNTVLSQDAVFITSLKERAIGLISSDKPRTIVFETRYGIHTFGMKYAIDVVILNKQKKVIALKENLQPNRFFLWRVNGIIVIELPLGTIRKTRTALHDHISYL